MLNRQPAGVCGDGSPGPVSRLAPPSGGRSRQPCRADTERRRAGHALAVRGPSNATSWGNRQPQQGCPELLVNKNSWGVQSALQSARFCPAPRGHPHVPRPPGAGPPNQTAPNEQPPTGHYRWAVGQLGSWAGEREGTGCTSRQPLGCRATDAVAGLRAVSRGTAARSRRSNWRARRAASRRSGLLSTRQEWHG